jgi:hypothetical protein
MEALAVRRTDMERVGDDSDDTDARLSRRLRRPRVDLSDESLPWPKTLFCCGGDDGVLTAIWLAHSVYESLSVGIGGCVLETPMVGYFGRQSYE